MTGNTPWLELPQVTLYSEWLLKEQVGPECQIHDQPSKCNLFRTAVIDHFSQLFHDLKPFLPTSPTRKSQLLLGLSQLAAKSVVVLVGRECQNLALQRGWTLNEYFCTVNDYSGIRVFLKLWWHPLLNSLRGHGNKTLNSWFITPIHFTNIVEGETVNLSAKSWFNNPSCRRKRTAKISSSSAILVPCQMVQTPLVTSSQTQQLLHHSWARQCKI